MTSLIQILKGGPGSGDFGHVGRAGKRGGSGGGGGKGRPRKGRRSREALDKETEVGRTGKRSIDFTKFRVPKFSNPSAKLGPTSLGLVRSFNRAFSDADIIDAKVVDNISKKSGVAGQTVKRFISSWNGKDVSEVEFISVQESAVRSLGAKQSSYDKKKREKIGGIGNPRLESDYDKIAKTVYDETQKQLKEMGVTKILLYRGIIYADNTNVPNVRAGGVANLELNALESWTISPEIAEDFTRSSTGTSFMLKSIIPADRIFSMPTSGPGTSAESEMIVIGNGNDKAKVSFRIEN